MACPLDQYFEADASRIVGELEEYRSIHGRISALMRKETLKNSIGYNYQTVVAERTAPPGGVIWTPIEAPDGAQNNCIPEVTSITWATTLLNFTAQQALLRSDKICFIDVRRGTLFQEQVKNIRENFKRNVNDAWEIADKRAFFENAGLKVVADANMTVWTGEADFGPVVPTHPAQQEFLDRIYQMLTQDGAGVNAYSYSGSAPNFVALMSMEASQSIIKRSPEVRQDFRFADMGKGSAATLLKSWGVDKSYAGFTHVIDNTMPRFNYVNGAWEEVPYYSQVGVHIGNAAMVSSAYQQAEFEDIYIWHPDVVTRQMEPTPFSPGAGINFEANPYTGQIVWKNIENGDETSCAYNPMKNWGQFYAQLGAAWKPGLRRYGVILRVRRCFTINLDGCVGGY